MVATTDAHYLKEEMAGARILGTAKARRIIDGTRTVFQHKIQSAFGG